MKYFVLLIILLFILWSGEYRHFIYLWVQYGSDTLKFGSFKDSLPAHWNRFSTLTSYRFVLLLWCVPSDMLLYGKGSVEECFLNYLRGDITGVSKENEVLYRFDDNGDDMLGVYIKVIFIIWNLMIYNNNKLITFLVIR